MGTALAALLLLAPQCSSQMCDHLTMLFVCVRLPPAARLCALSVRAAAAAAAANRCTLNTRHTHIARAVADGAHTQQGASAPPQSAASHLGRSPSSSVSFVVFSEGAATARVFCVWALGHALPPTPTSTKKNSSPVDPMPAPLGHPVITKKTGFGIFVGASNFWQVTGAPVEVGHTAFNIDKLLNMSSISCHGADGYDKCAEQCSDPVQFTDPDNSTNSGWKCEFDGNSAILLQVRACVRACVRAWAARDSYVSRAAVTRWAWAPG